MCSDMGICLNKSIGDALGGDVDSVDDVDDGMTINNDVDVDDFNEDEDVNLIIWNQ